MAVLSTPAGRSAGRFLSSGHTRRFFLRKLTEAAALRPFYGLVHPDLFGRYPEERAVNEDSLKRLHQYFDAARVHKSTSQKTRNLTFYVWNRDHDHFDRVVVPLSSSCTTSTVHNILSSCGMPAPPLPPTRTQPSRQLDSITIHSNLFDLDFETAFTSERPSAPAKKKDLSSFVTSIADEAWERSRSLSSSWQQVEQMTVSLCSKYNIASIIYQSECGAVSRLASLRRLEQLLTRKVRIRDCEGAMTNDLGFCLRGQEVVLGCGTGLDALGRVQLCCLDVPEMWSELLLNLSADLYRLRALASVEHQLSPLLGGVQLKRPSWLSAHSYRHGVEQLYLSMHRTRRSLSVPPCQFGDLHVFIDRVSPELHLRPDGAFICPPLSPPHDIIRFLSAHRRDALEKMDSHKRVSDEVHRLTTKAVDTLGLASLGCDKHLPLVDACRGLQRLLRQDWDSSRVRGLHVRLSSVFALSSDGEVYVACSE